MIERWILSGSAMENSPSNGMAITHSASQGTYEIGIPQIQMRIRGSDRASVTCTLISSIPDSSRPVNAPDNLVESAFQSIASFRTHPNVGKDEEPALSRSIFGVFEDMKRGHDRTGCITRRRSPVAILLDSISTEMDSNGAGHTDSSTCSQWSSRKSSSSPSISGIARLTNMI